MYVPSSGDIILTRGRNDRETVKVVVKACNYYSTVLSLYDNESYENEFALNVGCGFGRLHADLARLSYSKNVDMEDAECIRPLDTDEYNRLLKYIGKTLDIPEVCTAGSSDQELEKLKSDMDELLASMKVMEEENEAMKQSGQAEVSERMTEMQQQIESLHNEIEELMLTVVKRETERDVYEKLYKELLRNAPLNK